MMQTILIIDDDTAIGNLEQEVLERAGYAVLRAYSGTEALLLLKSSRPDLILLDLMLPGLSGEEVLPRIQGIPVIVISAKTAVQDKVDLLLGGAADYLTKPFDTKELLVRVAVRLREASRSPLATVYTLRGFTVHCPHAASHRRSEYRRQRSYGSWMLPLCAAFLTIFSATPSNTRTVI